MNSLPLLQVALDFTSLPKALVMALKVAEQVDIIEAGTPLCKAVGVEIVRALREVFPDKLILADFKTPDVGGLEAQMAFDAGADMMTVIGGAPLATIESALHVAHQRGKEILVELTGVRDILTRARDWKEIGIDRVVYHRGWDEQAAHREWTSYDLDVIRELVGMGFRVTITGGITPESLPFFKGLPVSIIVAGRAIHQASDPASAARQMREAIALVWGNEE